MVLTQTHPQVLNEADIAAQRRITSLLLIVCLQYFLGTVFMKNLPIIEMIWLLLVLLLLIFVKPKEIFPVVSLYLMFAVFYATGVFFDQRGTATLAYYRTILVWGIFSILLHGVLSGRLRSFAIPKVRLVRVHGLHFLAICWFALWSFGALRDLNAGLVIDHRDFTGGGYLTLSDTFAMFSLGCLCRDKIPSWEFAAILGLSLLVIFLLGSRSTLVFYPFAVAFLVGQRVSLPATLGWIGLVVVGALYWGQNRVDVQSGAFFRVRTLFSAEVDESARVRALIRENMIARLDDSPECFLISCHPVAGFYDHSILSVVEYFGLFGVAFLLALVAVFSFNLRYFRQQWFLPILIYCAISLLFSRAWVSVTFPVFVALVLGPLLVQKK